MLTGRKDREYFDAFNRTEAETYADKQERQRRLHDAFNRTGS